MKTPKSSLKYSFDSLLFVLEKSRITNLHNLHRIDCTELCQSDLVSIFISIVENYLISNLVKICFVVYNWWVWLI